jgi:hypothetical protein
MFISSMMNSFMSDSHDKSCSATSANNASIFDWNWKTGRRNSECNVDPLILHTAFSMGKESKTFKTLTFEPVFMWKTEHLLGR